MHTIIADQAWGQMPNQIRELSSFCRRFRVILAAGLSRLAVP